MEQYRSLAEAVFFTLRHCGTDVLNNPNQLLSYLADTMDPDGDEMRVLIHFCNHELIGPFRDALGNESGDLRNAEARARDYLEGECLINREVAHKIAKGISAGISRFQMSSPSVQPQSEPRIESQNVPRSTEYRSEPKHDRTLIFTPGVQDIHAKSRIDISGATVKSVAPQRFTGNPLRPSPEIVLRGTVLVSGRDYTLTYRDNVGNQFHESKATVTAVGAGDYSGSVDATFVILPLEKRNPVPGKDIHIDLDVTELEATLGTFKKVNYDIPSTGQSATCDVKVPKDSTEWSFVRVSGMGDYGVDGGSRGDLVVRLRVVSGPGSSSAGTRGRSANLTRHAVFAIALVVSVMGWLISRSLGSADEVDAPIEVEQTQVEQTQVEPGKGILYRGTTYMLSKQDTGAYALTSTSEDSENPTVIYEFIGTPIALMLCNTVFVIPENLPDGTWDLIAHPLGGGSVTQQVTDGNGKPIVRQGEIVEARLEGTELLITTDGGSTFTVNLGSE